MSKNSFGANSDLSASSFLKRFNGDRRYFEPGEREVAIKVSRYAAEDRNEFLAEYMVAILLGKTYIENINALY
jgi:hypothetical protein